MAQEHSSLFFLNSPAVMLIIDPETRMFRDVNKAAENFYGWSREQFLQMRVEDVNVLPIEELRNKIEQVRENDKIGFEFRHRLANGEIKDVEIFSGTLRIDGSEMLHTVVQDITERKKNEKRINLVLKQLSDYKQALDASSNVVITDSEGIILEVNDRTCELSGYSREELIGKSTSVNRSGYHPDSFYKELWHTIKEGKIWRGDIRNKAKNGSEYWVDTTIVPFLDDDGNPERFMAIRFEITKEKEAENKIEQNEKRFRAMIHDGTDYFCTVDLEYRYTFLSPSYEKMLGIAADELIGTRGIDFVHPDDLEQVEGFFTSLKENETRSGIIYRFKNETFGWRWVESSITRKVKDPAVGGFVINSRDITDTYLYSQIDSLERKSLEQFLQGETSESIYQEIIRKMESLLPGARFLLLNPVRDSHSSPEIPVIQGNLIEKEIQALAAVAARNMKMLPEPFGDRIEMATLGELTGSKLLKKLTKNSNQVKGYPVLDHETDQLRWLLITLSDQEKIDYGWLNLLSVRFREFIKMIQLNQQKDAELQESNRRFELVQNATNDAIYDWDLESNFLDWGEGIQKSFGYKAHDKRWMIDKWYEKIHPQDVESVRKDLEMTIMEGSQSKWNYEYRFRREDNSYAYVFENGYILRDENGKARRMIGAIRDVTGRMRRVIASELMVETGKIFNQEASLSSALELVLKALIEKLDIGLAEIWLSDRERMGVQKVAQSISGGKIAEVYNSIEAIRYAKKGEGLPGRVFEKGVTELWKSGDHADDYLRLEAAERAELKFAQAIPLRHAEMTIGVLLTASAKLSSQEIDHSLLEEEYSSVLAGEISRMQAEIELNEIFKFTPDILCIAGIDGYFKRVNPAASTLLGYSMQELLEKPYKSFVHPDDLQVTMEMEATLEAGSDVSYFENRYITKSGNEVWLAWTSRVFQGEETFFGVAKDITSRKGYEESLKKMNTDLEHLVRELEKSNEELEQFAFVTSHDLQEPLRMISSFISQLEKNYVSDLDEKAERYIHFIKDGALRMRRIITDLLEYSRIGRVNTNLTEVNLNQTVNRLKSLFRKTVHDKNAELLVDNLPVVIGSEQGLTQVFQNLIGNALKYTRNGVMPRVELFCKEEDEFWLFCVKDNGIGIEEEYSDKIFTIFQRLHSREEYDGSGVGLAICKKIVENHNGRIWVESVKGEGSTFCFTISKWLSVSQTEAEE